MAELWSRFVSTLRLAYWEQQAPLPRMRLGQQQQQQQAKGAGSSGGHGSGRPEAPTLQHSLLHQKLQLLDLCIHLQQQRQEQQQQQQEAGSGVANGGAEDGEQPPPSPTSSSSSYHSAAGGSDASQSPGKTLQQRSQPKQQLATAGLAGSASGDLDGRESAAAFEPGERPGEASSGLEQTQGVAGVLPGGACLHLHPSRPLRVPEVQEPPAHTEDLLAERQAALQASACISVLGAVWTMLPCMPSFSPLNWMRLQQQPASVVLSTDWPRPHACAFWVAGAAGRLGAGRSGAAGAAAGAHAGIRHVGFQKCQPRLLPAG